jgi:uncharacterized repeat protein (TIGR03803 family)
MAGLIYVGGALYGTARASGNLGDGPGTVYKTTPTGQLTLLHSFTGPPDGAEPSSSLLKVGKLFYGTTATGGTGACDFNTQDWPGCGTVFSMTRDGKVAVIYSFQATGDGALPFAGLINVNGLLYGTTAQGGAFGYGTVFSITPSGTERVVYSFKGGSDGAYPQASLLNVDEVLYGTTVEGGRTCGVTSSCGTVFAVTTAGSEAILYAFKGGADGEGPRAALINVNGTMYGTTVTGGAFDAGTVFSVSKKGKETVVYSFAGGADGSEPSGALLNLGGLLYGTTSGGGSGNCGPGGCGTIFEVTP